MGAPVSNHIPKQQYLLQKNQRKIKTAPTHKLDPLEKANNGSEKGREKAAKRGPRSGAAETKLEATISKGKQETNHVINKASQEKLFFYFNSFFLSLSPLFLFGLVTAAVVEVVGGGAGGAIP